MAPEVISLMVGTNDAKVGVSIENFRIAYDLLITKIKVAYPAALLLLFKIPFLTEGVKLPYKTDMNEIISSYNDCIEEMAKAYQLAFLLVNFSKSETFDGVHLNSSGVEKAAQILSKKILSYRE
jgi:lysophospholipase L1-like esterase